MKKIFFLVTIIAVMVTCMVACSNNSKSEQEGVDIPMDVTITLTTQAEEIEEVPELPKLSKNFIETALRFIDEYSTPSKELENLAAEAIQQSNGFEDNLYDYLNYYLVEEHGEEIRQFFGYNYEEVETVKVFIHNYQAGGNVGCVAFNGQEPFYNYEHNKLILAAGVLGDTYPDNITLAEARVASYVITQMSQNDVEDCCIVTTTKESDDLCYDFTFENEALKEKSKEILTNLLEE